MNAYKLTIEEIQKRHSQLIETKLTGLAKTADAEKNKLFKTVSVIKDLTQKIQGYMQKFDKLKEDMGSNSAKFETYNHEVEQKRAQIQTLEAEITTSMMVMQKEQKLKEETESETKKIEGQIKIYTDLKNAL